MLDPIGQWLISLDILFLVDGVLGGCGDHFIGGVYLKPRDLTIAMMMVVVSCCICIALLMLFIVVSSVYGCTDM